MKTWATDYVTILPYNVVNIITDILRKWNKTKALESIMFIQAETLDKNSEVPDARNQIYEAPDYQQNSKPSASLWNKLPMYT